MPLRIRDLREDHDYSQKKLAALLHISQSTYSRYELETLEIPYPALCRLADFYGTSVDYLLGRTNNPIPYAKK